ncbi:MAG TPA: Gfo/Idh/MocA family oxidoreductase [Thermoanaerobaculia bacterium]|nr:Gfo/Idh/MocA family oxidoreductase [Thermoanaerobaculia bacterium]
MTRSPDEPIRLAVVGVGHLGRHHARIAATLTQARCVGVHDHRPGRAEEVGREFGLTVLPTLESVAEAADAVVVATPTASHAEISEYLLSRGRDVLIEKPMAASLSEADRLIRLARERDRIIAVGHVERHNPAVEAALAMVERPQFVEVHRLGAFTPRSLDVDVVFDLMIHDLQIVRALAGEAPVEVRGVGVPVLTPRVDIANARIAFPGGMVANLTASRVSSERVRKCRIFAPSKYVSIDMQEQSVNAFSLARQAGASQIVPVEVAVRKEEPLARELADFVDAVGRRRPALVTGEIAREALALGEAVRAAIEEHRRAVEGITV